MIQLFYLAVDIVALIVLGASLFALGIAAGLQAVKQDAHRLSCAVKEMSAAHEEFAAKAIETIEFQRATIIMLTSPETREFDGLQKFN